MSLLITPRINFSDQEYNVGSIAVRDVRAERDLLAEDKAATEQKKNEKVSAYYHDIGMDPSIRSLHEIDFRYMGPKPQSREASLVLFGDVMEASSRTLSNPTPARIKNLVRERIERVFMDGQLNECDLTFDDLNKIADSFTRILNGIFHQRIDYPEPVIREFNGNKKANKVDTDRRQAEKNRN